MHAHKHIHTHQHAHVRTHMHKHKHIHTEIKDRVVVWLVVEAARKIMFSLVSKLLQIMAGLQFLPIILL